MRRYLSILALLVAVCLTFQCAAIAQAAAPRISDKEFWRMVTEFSEDGGFFPFENFVSNEDAFVAVIPNLNKETKTGGAYFGVGPEQNFTYINALQSKIAFILDIRRQNMIEHLLYKVMFEMSENRVAFLSRLFSRSIPEGLTEESTANELFQKFRSVKADQTQYETNLKEAIDRIKGHGFTITEEDEKSIAFVYTAFFKGGPQLNYTFDPAIQSRPSPRELMPSYENLMVSKDGSGKQQSYLASEGNFRFIRDMQRNNLIVPLVGDFAGPKAIRAAGTYLKGAGITVSVFYTSNVEQYLFEEAGKWRRFYDNVGSLPLDESSTFIRANSTGRLSTYQPAGVTGRWLSLTCPIVDLLHNVESGQIQNYYDVFAFSH